MPLYSPCWKSTALGLWAPPYWRMVRSVQKRFGHSIDYYDFAIITAGFPHIEGRVVHDPNDAVTPYAESRRYHDFWPESYLYSPAEGGHHLCTVGITPTVLRYIQNGEAPPQSEKQEQPLYAEHELVRYFAGL